MVTMKIETPQSSFCIIAKLESTHITITFNADNYESVQYSWLSVDNDSAQELYFYVLRKLIRSFNERMPESVVLSRIESLKLSTLYNWIES